MTLRHPPAAISCDKTLSMARAEQAEGWRSGTRPTAEELLARHPGIAADTEAALVLIYGEVLLREEVDGVTPNLAEYAARFPAYASALTAQFELHGALQQPGPLPSVPGFEIEREIGRGGMGAVYLARDCALRREVAIKVLLSGEFASPVARLRFRAEAESAAGLKHANIVEIHTFGEHDGRPYLVMEYLPGGNLAQRLGGTPIDPRAAARLTRTLADAVQHAHSAGIVHRDLKPANILLTSREPERPAQTPVSDAPGSPKITDFGLAKKLDVGGGATETSQVLGTPSYMAPEQAGGAKRVGPAADIYSLGAILYECLAGRPPFKAATQIDTLAHVLDREPASPRSLNPAVPRDLETICLKCLNKEPDKRYVSAGDLREDLQRYLDGRPVMARPVGPTGRAWRWIKRRPALAGMAAALIVLIPTALVTTTVLYLRAEQRGRESLALRRESIERMSRLAMSRSREQWAPDAAELHRACAEEYARLAEAGVDPADARLRRAEHISWEAFENARIGDYAKCKEIAESAIAAFEACLIEQPASVIGRQGLFEARFRRAVGMRRIGQSEETLRALDDLIAEAHDVFGDDQSSGSKLCLTLRDLYHTRASALLVLERFAESSAAYDEALRYDDGTHWSDLVILRAALYARSGQAARALETLHAQLTNPHLSGWNLLNAACGYALASTAPELPESARMAAADAGVETLRRALATAPALRDAMQKDADLNSLRGRPDFQALFADK